MKRTLFLIAFVIFSLVTSVMAVDINLENGPSGMNKADSMIMLETKDKMLDTVYYDISTTSKDGNLMMCVLTKYQEGNKVYFYCTRFMKALVYKTDFAVKFDDERGYTIPIEVSRDHYTAIIRNEDDEADFIKMCLKHKKLQVRLTEYDGRVTGNVTHVFNLSHFKEYYKQITKLQKKAR